MKITLIKQYMNDNKIKIQDLEKVVKECNYKQIDS